ncbi:alanine racemase [Candidatus Uhrbacteria bacterium]|nr:alanine racemase [Candidatus Uhrbacteria bacterium]
MQVNRTWVEINARALTSNIQTLTSLLDNDVKFCAVLKANAYGHGLTEVASIAREAGVDAFAVDHIDDAILLRELYPSSLILVLGFTLFDRYKDALRHDIHLTLYDREGIEHAHQIGKEYAQSFPIHLKIETGTTRQGILREDLEDIIRLLQRSEMVEVAGISTHFASIEDSHNPDYAEQQFTRFQDALNLFEQQGISPPWKHCACSAAIILYPQTHLTLVRAGISFYGIWSSELVQNTVRTQGFSCDLQPVLTWKTRIAQIKSVPMGTPIGYGLTEVMKRSGRIAVLPVGYWDGYDRLLSSVGEVLIKGTRCKVMGRICMNMMMVDVSQVPNPQKEDEVVLLGTDGSQRISASEIAQKTQTIPYEVLARINPLLPRIVV